jgi:uncharacterized peroxidase-related enzyme
MAIISSLKEKEINDVAKLVYKKFKEKTGSVPEWVKVMAHSPSILKEFTELFNSVMKEGEIDLLLKWKIAYTVSQALKCPFCVDVTKKMITKLGAEKEVLKELEKTTEKDRRILELVKDVTDDAIVNQTEIFEKIRENHSEKQIVEIVSVIGLFNYINRFNNTLGVLPE